jgi:6-phosphofructokinase
LANDTTKPVKIGVIYLGRHSPGGNNVIDGLLRYQKLRGNVELLGFVHGLNGLMNDNIAVIKEETYKPFRNLGGYDYLGRSHDSLRTPE